MTDAHILAAEPPMPLELAGQYDLATALESWHAFAADHPDDLNARAVVGLLVGQAVAELRAHGARATVE